MSVRRDLMFYDESVRAEAERRAIRRKGDVIELAIADHIELGKVGRLQQPVSEPDELPTIDERQTPTPKQVASWAVAAAAGRYVPPEVVKERLATCGSCEYMRSDAKGMWCGLCGCALTADANRVRNLAAFEEKLDPDAVLKVGPISMGRGKVWGCKHPRRGQGEGWKR